MPVRGMTLAHLHRADLGYGSDACRVQLDNLKNLNVNWIAINPFAYMPQINKPGLSFGGDRSMSRNNMIRVVKDAHERGMSVLIKPHIWSGEFARGKSPMEIAMTTDADWDVWFASFTDYIMDNAKLAQESGAEALSVGCELEGTSKHTERWKKLIAQVRTVYTGKLVYAAAFEEWKQIEFWEDLDCVGINAYWPVADVRNASDEEVRAGWRNRLASLVTFAKKINRPICFTELGYTLSDKAAMEPWEYAVETENAKLQERLYTIALEETRASGVVVGVFVWKWFTADAWKRHERGDPFAIQDNAALVERIKHAWMH